MTCFFYKFGFNVFKFPKYLVFFFFLLFSSKFKKLNISLICKAIIVIFQRVFLWYW